MNTQTKVGIGVVAVATVLGIIFSLQNFNASTVACDAIDEARKELQSLYDAGVTASVQIFAEERSGAEERLSECINARPNDPCADAQKTRDEAVASFNNIVSPPDSAPYAEFQNYFTQRDIAYKNYKQAKDALDQCRTKNPPKPEVPYESSNTKACFDAYDTSMAKSQSIFTQNTQAMRTALNAGLAGLDAREKACNPPKGKDAFTDPVNDGESEQTDASVNLASCRLLKPENDPELATLRSRAGAIPAEIQALDDSIENVVKRESKLRVDLADVDTYIPPESTKTQFEGALNALRAERKVNIESGLDFYKNLRERRGGEKATLEQELRDIEAKINERLEQIKKENEKRQRTFPTALHQAKPDKCEYYHCHGMLCGIPDPQQDSCGHGATTESDIDCSKFFDSYLQEAGV